MAFLFICAIFVEGIFSVNLNFGQWFRRRCCLKKKLMQDGTGQRLITIAHLELSAQVS